MAFSLQTSGSICGIFCNFKFIGPIYIHHVGLHVHLLVELIRSSKQTKLSKISIPTLYFDFFFFFTVSKRRLWLTLISLCFFIFRYFYYLQLKSDIIEGILPCSVEQAITLAGLAAQGNSNSIHNWCLRLFSHDGKVRILNFNSKCAFWIKIQKTVL